MAKGRGKESSVERAQRLAAVEQARLERDRAKIERQQYALANKALKEYAKSLPSASYRGAVQTRLSRPWSGSQSVTGVPHLSKHTHTKMRDRARQLERDDPFAEALLTRVTDNIVGASGFKLQVLSADPAWNAKAEALMNRWFDTADWYGHSWVQHQKLAVRALYRDGDIGDLLTSSGKLQLIEGDYITNPTGKAREDVYDGVEIDQYGRARRYHVRSVDDNGKDKFLPIDAKDLILLKRIKSASQLRGEVHARLGTRHLSGRDRPHQRGQQVRRRDLRHPVGRLRVGAGQWGQVNEILRRGRRCVTQRPGRQSAPTSASGAAVTTARARTVFGVATALLRKPRSPLLVGLPSKTRAARIT